MSTLRSLSTAALVVALAAGLAAAPAIAATAQGQAATEDVTWGVRTASNQYGPARSNFTYAIEPGQVLTDAIVISNHDAAELDLDIYAADAFTTTSGQLDVLTAGESSENAGLWVDLGQDSVRLAGTQTVEIPFTITVPENATPGDYAAGIVTSLTREDQAEGINVDRRLGVRIYFRVGGVVHPDLTIENFTVEYTGTPIPFGTGSAAVSFTVHNTGNVRLSSQTAASASGPFGIFTTTAIDVPPVPELLPGESWDAEFVIDGVSPTFWVGAAVELTPTIPLLDGAPTPPESAPVRVEGGTWGIPWPTLVLLVVIAAIVLAVVRYRRVRGSQQAAREKALVAAAVESALLEHGVGASVGAASTSEDSTATPETQTRDE